MLTWLSGWSLGISVAAPIGPVNVATIRLGLSNGFPPAFAFGMGAATIDALYCLAVYFGLAPLLVAAPWLRVLLYLAGAILLARMGWSAMRRRIEITAGDERVSSTAWRSYVSGAALTAVNPATIVSWLAVGGAALAAVPSGQGLLLILGIFAGSACWFGALALGTSLGRKVASERVLRSVSLASGLALLAFAGLFAWGGLAAGLALAGITS